LLLVVVLSYDVGKQGRGIRRAWTCICEQLVVYNTQNDILQRGLNDHLQTHLEWFLAGIEIGSMERIGTVIK
jgi:hypothetical protein